MKDKMRHSSGGHFTCSEAFRMRKKHYDRLHLGDGLGGIKESTVTLTFLFVMSGFHFLRRQLVEEYIALWEKGS